MARPSFLLILVEMRPQHTPSNGSSFDILAYFDKQICVNIVTFSR